MLFFFFFLATVCVCVLRDGFCESMSFLTSFFFPLVFSVHVRAVQLIVHRRLNSDTELKSPKALSHEKKKKTVMSAKERCREREKRREKKWIVEFLEVAWTCSATLVCLCVFIHFLSYCWLVSKSTLNRWGKKKKQYVKTRNNYLWWFFLSNRYVTQQRQKKKKENPRSGGKQETKTGKLPTSYRICSEAELSRCVSHTKLLRQDRNA